MTMPGLAVIFRTKSDIEANVVEALLDSHGVETLRTAGPSPVLPFSATPLGETEISVREEDAAHAVASSRATVNKSAAHRRAVPQEFDALEARGSGIASAIAACSTCATHKSKAHEDPSGV